MLLCRALIDALLPPGSLWSPQDGEGLDLLLEGIAAHKDTVRKDLALLAHVRHAQGTGLLPDLEREYGIMPALTTTEQDRRDYLESVQSAGQSDGSLDTLQDTLQRAGFSVHVHANNPPVDPGFFLFYAPSAIVGNETAIVGASQVAGKRGELLVNGDVYSGQVLARYTVPVPSQYWPLVFFVGGTATRNGAGELTDIAPASVPVARRAELINLILRIKPMHSWAGLMLQYV